MPQDTDNSNVAPTESPAPAPVLGYHVPRSGKLVSVASCGDAAEAQMVASALAAAGIPSAVVNEHTNALGGYVGRTWVEVHVGVEDRDRAAALVSEIRSGDAFVPEDDPPDGSADIAADADGTRVPLAVAATFETARDMYDAAAVLGAARIPTYLPNLLPRGPRPGGAQAEAQGRPPAFKVRVTEDDLPRARALLEEAEEDEDEPRCPRCGSWRVHREGGSFLYWLKDLFVGGRADGVRALECLACGHRFPWGSPRGTFEVVVPDERER
jgi:hypothetical protein